MSTAADPPLDRAAQGPETDGGPTRRAVLAGLGAGAGLVVLAACTGGRDSSDEALASGTDLAAVSDIPVGGALAVTVDDAPVIVAQPAEGEIVAFDALCTHQRCPVDPGPGDLRCPCHGSRFDLGTGDVLSGPADRPLPSIAVVVRGGRVVTA